MLWRDLFRCRIDLLNFPMGFNIVAPYMVCVTHKWISPSLICSVEFGDIIITKTKIMRPVFSGQDSASKLFDQLWLSHTLKQWHVLQIGPLQNWEPLTSLRQFWQNPWDETHGIQVNSIQNSRISCRIHMVCQVGKNCDQTNQMIVRWIRVI